MAEDFYLDEAGVTQFTRGVRSTGDQMDTSFTTLESTLNGYVGCWGDDEIGMAFQGNYWSNSQTLIEGLRGAGRGLVDSAGNVDTAASNFAALDHETAKWLDSQKPPE